MKYRRDRYIRIAIDIYLIDPSLPDIIVQYHKRSFIKPIKTRFPSGETFSFPGNLFVIPK